MSTRAHSRWGTLFGVVALSLGTAAACSNSTSADTLVKPGRWGSAQAILTTTDSDALLEIGGGCIGSYGEMEEPIPAGAFALHGTYTQLMGVAPGMVVYPAHFSGTATGETVVITITVSANQTLGPYTLTYGLGSARDRCLFP
jgi:hypothetical protein